MKKLINFYGGFTKNPYIGGIDDTARAGGRGLGQFPGLREGLTKKREVMFSPICIVDFERVFVCWKLV